MLVKHCTSLLLLLALGGCASVNHLYEYPEATPETKAVDYLKGVVEADQRESLGPIFATEWDTKTYDSHKTIRAKFYVDGLNPHNIGSLNYAFKLLCQQYGGNFDVNWCIRPSGQALFRFIPENFKEVNPVSYNVYKGMIATLDLPKSTETMKAWQKWALNDFKVTKEIDKTGSYDWMSPEQREALERASVRARKTYDLMYHYYVQPAPTQVNVINNVTVYSNNYFF